MNRSLIICTCLSAMLPLRGLCGPATNAPVVPVKIEHAAIGAKVTASSTHYGEPGEGKPDAIVDGDLSTRWSSDYTSPQEIVVEFPNTLQIAKLRLHWEKAAATKYSVHVSQNAKDWQGVHLCFMTGSEPMDRTDDINLKNIAAKAIKLSLQSCINTNWGYSLYEMEVVAAGANKTAPQPPAAATDAKPEKTAVPATDGK